MCCGCREDSTLDEHLKRKTTEGGSKGVGTEARERCTKVV